MNHLLIPAALIAEDRWVLWRCGQRRGKPRKFPKQTDGESAKTNDPSTWTSFAKVQEAFSASDTFDGIGFVLGDGWAGVDLDDVIVDGETKPWAEDLISSLNSYSEISPSGDGVKVFVKGDFPDAGKNRKTGEGSGVEVYCRGRYFTVTGDHYGGSPRTVNDAQAALHDIRYRFYSDGLEQIDDAFASMKRRLEEMPESIEGSAGSDRTFHAACEIVRWGFDDEQGMELLEHYNEHRCHPQWSEAELKHKWESAKEAEEKKGPLPTTPAVPRTPFSLDLIDDEQFAGKRYDQNFLVEKLIIGGEPLILGGPSKTMKTTVLVDLAVSIANGVPCLGYFDVPEPRPVIVISGESGGATLQKTAKRVREARGVTVNRKNLFWGLRLPNLSLKEHLDALKRDIKRTGAALTAVDPAYLSLLAGGDEDAAKNVFRMGIILNAFGQVGKDTGTTLVLVHHFNKQVKQGASPTLTHLSQSGFSEWARQWILLNHNKPYGRGTAELRVNVGGSAGHGSNYLWGLDQGQQMAGGGWSSWSVKVEDLDAPDFSEPPKDDRVAERVEKLREEIEEGKLYSSSTLKELLGINTGKRDLGVWDNLIPYAEGTGVLAKCYVKPSGGKDNGLRFTDPDTAEYYSPSPLN